MKLSEGTKRKLFVLSFVLWCVDAGLYLLSFFWTQMYRWGALLFLPLFVACGFVVSHRFCMIL